MLGAIAPFSVFVGICSTLGYWIARRLPDDLLQEMKDPRNNNWRIR